VVLDDPRAQLLPVTALGPGQTRQRPVIPGHFRIGPPQGIGHAADDPVQQDRLQDQQDGRGAEARRLQRLGQVTHGGDQGAGRRRWMRAAQAGHQYRYQPHGQGDDKHALPVHHRRIGQPGGREDHRQQIQGEQAGEHGHGVRHHHVAGRSGHRHRGVEDDESRGSQRGEEKRQVGHPGGQGDRAQGGGSGQHGEQDDRQVMVLAPTQTAG